MQMMPFSFRSIEELELGAKWRAVFEERWPHYREWFLREGEAARPSYATSARMLRAHMPELMPAYDRVVELAGGSDLAARMLSLYKPPPYLAACSQGVWSRGEGPVLVRNYDYAPSRMEGVVWSTRMAERRVIGMSDCLWGLLDGMNDAGLAVSLTFGGRRVLGDGFGIPIVVRYLLEFMDVDYEIDVDELNERWAQPANIDDWTQFILKQTDERVERITQAPASGIWRMGADHSIAYARRDTDWHTVADEHEAFYLRIAGPGQFRYPGADLGIMVTRGRFLGDDRELTDRAHHWIAGVQSQFASVPIGQEAPPIRPEPFGFKML